MTENNFNFTNGVSYDVWYELRRLIDQLNKENEELKKNNQILCDLYKNVDSCLQKRTEKFDRYRKALEEIEKYTREQFCDNCEDIGSTEYNCHCEYCEYQEYFDIIAKAKDGK